MGSGLRNPEVGRPSDANRLVIGTAQFGLEYGIANRGGRVSDEEARRILATAKSAGVDMLDTAALYGESEALLGSIGIADWQVVSKLPSMPENCADPASWVLRAVEGSLRRLRRDNLFGLLLHRPKQLLDAAGARLYNALAGLKHAGLVSRIGISVYSTEELDTLLPRYRFDLVQAPFSILDQQLIEGGWMERLVAEGIDLHVRSVFLQGLLLMRHADRPRWCGRWPNLWSAWDYWLHDNRLTPLEACLRFVLSKPGIGGVIVGVDTNRQLEDILAAAPGPLPPLPESLRVNDTMLLNPSNWVKL